ncbi:metallophosphoesterase [Roseiflexus sp.]|jgi:hypothetical protein
MYRNIMIVLLALYMLALAMTPQGLAAQTTGPRLLTDPFLQLPTATTVRVVWFTEFEGQRHFISYGEGLRHTAEATTMRMTRMYEDASSRILGRPSPSRVTERPIWRHEAIATGLIPNVRVPYTVTSIDDTGNSVTSRQFTLQPLPTPGTPMKILLTSDQQNRLMSPANFQKVIETVGRVDAVFFAGDFVDEPSRASEWFDRFDPNWRNVNNPANPGYDPNRPAFFNARPAFFPSLQGKYREIFPEFPYTGGEILQHAPLFGAIGNHEAPGRWRPNAEFTLNGRTQVANLSFMDNDPQPRWFAEIRYEQLKRSDPNFNPTNDPVFREQWITDNSYNFTSYFEVWTLPDDGPAGESYYAYKIGDVFVISMNVSRVWRTWNLQEGPTSARFSPRGKYTEFSSELNNPGEWGFGDMWFETYDSTSDQYAWLVRQLESPAFKSSKYRIVLAHQTVFGLGDNSVPVMSNPETTIIYNDGGVSREKTFVWPVSYEVWESEIQPLVDARAITEIRIEYPLEKDVWRNQIEPLLLEHGVQMVHNAHSHVWNRTIVEGADGRQVHYIETSNVGNSFGAYLPGWKDSRVPWATSFWNEVTGPNPRWNPANYPRAGDPHNRAPVMPTLFNPMREMEGTDRDWPFVDSNNVTVFTIFDTATGAVSSYAFDTRKPDSAVVKFDEFFLNPAAVDVFPTTPLRDTFDRADGRLGRNWIGATQPDQYRISGNQVDVEKGGAVLWRQQFGANQEAFVTLSTIDPNSQHHTLLLKGRGANATQGAILVSYDAVKRQIVVEALRPGWGWYQVQTFSNITLEAGDVLGARALADGSVHVYVNYVPMGVADTTTVVGGLYVNRGGRIGLFFHEASNAAFDHFGGGDR